MNNFTQRTLSGAVYVALVVASILVHPLFFGILFGLINILALREFHHLMNSGKLLTISSIAIGTVLFSTVYMLENWQQMPFDLLLILSLGYMFLLMIPLIAGLFTKRENPIHDWGYVLISQVMIALPFALMTSILAENNFMLLSLFILIWVNDSAAYCVGSIFGKTCGNHKMFPRVSPGKSWEGLFGGLIVALAVGIWFNHIGWLCTDSLLKTILFTLVVVIFGTLGDLMESIMKRTIGIKDSGHFMPGHGGVLDRFDSLLLAVPAVWMLIHVFGLI